jgi:hypothetical protein
MTKGFLMRNFGLELTAECDALFSDTSYFSGLKVGAVFGDLPFK